MDRAIVELDPLPDPDRATTDDQRRGPLNGGKFRLRAAGGIRGVEVRRLGGELRRARVHHGVARHEAEFHTSQPNRLRIHAGHLGQLAIAETGALHSGEEFGGVCVRGVRDARADLADVVFQGHGPLELPKEPGRDAGRATDRFGGHAAAEKGEDPPQP